MDKKYNGFNNGRDRSDGVGGREVNHGKQETMTKENTAIEILVEHIRVMDLTGFPADWELVNNAIDQSIRELSAERERAGKLVDSLQKLAWHLDRLKQYDIVELIKQTLNEYDPKK